MRALQLAAPEQWNLIDIPEPAIQHPTDVLLKVHRVGVCGTDIGGYLGKFPFFSYPRIPGHELGVEVLAVGSEVSHVRPGDRCSIEPYINCGTCYACRRGHTNCCTSNKTLGVMCDGGLADRIVLPARKLHVANDLTYEQAALVETLAIGCHAVDRGMPKPGEQVLVIGAGPIGLSALEFVKLSGARPIVADISESRLQFVRDVMKVPDTIQVNGSEADIKALEEMTSGQFADLVIDATGNHRSMVRALEFTAFAGRVVFVGITQQNLELPHAPYFHRRELTLLASRNALPGDFKRIISLIGSGAINTAPWITHHGNIDEVPSRFREWIDPNAGVMKAIIHVGD